ncbi:MAG: ABC transporter ATP-binding protein [Oscillospiraceae bacterium]|nr:ABC transporter ATP-binding protein [Oscillospiraceae bacterium]
MDYILECKALTKRYSNKTALDAVDLKLAPGHIVGLLGPNGSGKTTLIKLANGLLTPSSGEIRIDGQKPCAQTKAIVSYLPERNALPEWMSVEQAIDFYADFYADFRRDAANEMVAQLVLEPKQRIKAMSKGTKEKLQLILIMSRKAKLYLLDEPIGGVDPAARDYILHTIVTACDPGATVLISTHLIRDVEPILDGFVFIGSGRCVMSGEAEAVRRDSGKTLDELFREVFRCY